MRETPEKHAQRVADVCYTYHHPSTRTLCQGATRTQSTACLCRVDKAKVTVEQNIRTLRLQKKTETNRVCDQKLSSKIARPFIHPINADRTAHNKERSHKDLHTGRHFACPRTELFKHLADVGKSNTTNDRHHHQLFAVVDAPFRAARFARSGTCFDPKIHIR